MTQSVSRIKKICCG